MSDVVENKAMFRRFMEEVATMKNLGAIDEFMASDFIEHEQLPPGTPAGREAARFFFTQWRQGFPDGRAHLDMEIAEGEFVVCHETWTALTRAVLPAFPRAAGLLPSGSSTSHASAAANPRALGCRGQFGLDAADRRDSGAGPAGRVEIGGVVSARNKRLQQTRAASFSARPPALRAIRAPTARPRCVAGPRLNASGALCRPSARPRR